MEDGNTAQLSAVPFRLVLGELRVDGLQKWAHKWDLVGGADDRTLVVVVLDCEKGNPP